MSKKQKKSKKSKIEPRKVLKSLAKKIRNILTSIINLPISLIRAIISLPAKVFSFLKSVRNELKLVEWLSRKGTARWSFAVILTALLLGASIVLTDSILFKLRTLLFNKL